LKRRVLLNGLEKKEITNKEKTIKRGKRGMKY
jgi:hypothetical protein